MNGKRNQHLRRGGIYAVVLVAALIVTTIGLSALTATRLHVRAAEEVNDVVEAHFYAQSAIELGLHAISTVPSWRSSFTHDVWLPERPIGNGSCFVKFLDEEDADLANDDTQPVRLYGKGVAGDAVRIYSVIVVEAEPGSVANNLLTNGDMESGVSPWVEFGDCDLESRPDGPHGGVAYLCVKNRDDSNSGPRQEIASKLTSGTAYDCTVWAKMKDFSEDLRVILWLRTSLGWTSQTIATTSVDQGWTLVSGSFTPFWTGSLYEALWKCQSTWSDQEFNLDDATLTEAGSGGSSPVYVTVRGTWRREVLP